MTFSSTVRVLLDTSKSSLKLWRNALKSCSALPVALCRFSTYQIGQRRADADEEHTERRQQCRELCVPAGCVEDVLDDEVVAGLA